MRTLEQVGQIMAKAAKTNRERSAADHEVGFAAPEDCPPFDLLRTIDFALEAGLSCENWDCVAEGLDMLRMHIKRLPEWSE